MNDKGDEVVVFDVWEVDKLFDALVEVAWFWTVDVGIIAQWLIKVWHKIIIMKQIALVEAVIILGIEFLF